MEESAKDVAPVSLRGTNVVGIDGCPRNDQQSSCQTGYSARRRMHDEETYPLSALPQTTWSPSTG